MLLQVDLTKFVNDRIVFIFCIKFIVLLTVTFITAGQLLINILDYGCIESCLLIFVARLTKAEKIQDHK